MATGRTSCDYGGFILTPRTTLVLCEQKWYSDRNVATRLGVLVTSTLFILNFYNLTLDMHIISFKECQDKIINLSNQQ